ncbi:DoxX family protein [Agarivorans aestuarii]|uniref:DoxX family protein n=2 Tax=Agarivorans aestuarii TaxID=1563703 RepID=A0ABU7G9M3_9ALTE|nr:DoxX family protein [Agarivorans aestuarii]
MNLLQQLSQPTARVFLALIFILSGYGKIAGYAGTQGYMEAMGVPGALLPLVIALELLGGLAILVGWKTRPVAFLLAGFSLLSGLLFHFNPGDQMQMIMLMKNIAIAGGFLLLVAHGGGAYSLDKRGVQD